MLGDFKQFKLNRLDTFPSQGGYSPKWLVCRDRNKTDSSIKDTIYQVTTSPGDGTQVGTV